MQLARATTGGLSTHHKTPRALLPRPARGACVIHAQATSHVAGTTTSKRLDIGGPATNMLNKMLSMGQIDITGQRCLVLGCGCGPDVDMFVQAGAAKAVGLDLATRACSGNKVAEHFVRSCDLCADDQPEAGDHVKLAPREFFSWQDPSGGADFAYDSTFGCSMQNDVRKKWAAHWARLVRPGGRLMTLMYPVAPPGQGRVPPFPVSPEQYKSVLSEAGFEEELLCPVPTNLSDKNRAGMEWLGIWRRRA